MSITRYRRSILLRGRLNGDWLYSSQRGTRRASANAEVRSELTHVGSGGMLAVVLKESDKLAPAETALREGGMSPWLRGLT